MSKETIFELMTLNAFYTRTEALEFRKKIMHEHLYGVYGVYQSEDKQMWVVMPLKALNLMQDYKEKDE